jgi:Tol biopolymer transport system component
VGFRSDATDLVPGDSNGTTDVFVRDLLNGTTERVSLASNGTQGNDYSGGAPGFSADGRYMMFESGASNLVPGDTNHRFDIFVRDRLGGLRSRACACRGSTV